MNEERYPNENVKYKVEQAPNKPGIYQYFNDIGKIIYVGKAKNLKNRIRSYFQQGRVVDAKTKAMITKINDLEVIVVDSEAEALLLEDTLIKKYKPKYNVLLRDDKSYPFIKVTSEHFPRIFPTRKLIKDGSKYFGPYTDVRNMKNVLRLIRTLLMIRSCDLNLTQEAVEKGKFKYCLDYHIQKCEAPCVGYILMNEYRKNIDYAVQILNGKTKDVEKRLEEEMYKLSEELKFEKAHLVKMRLSSLQEYSAKQKIIALDMIDRDIFGLARLDDNACSLILKIRDGKLIGKRHFIIKNAAELTDSDIITKTIEKWYIESEYIPKEIYLPLEIEEMELLTDWLSSIKKRVVDIHIPKLGDKRKLVEMALTNAEFLLKEYVLSIERREQSVPRPVLSLQRDLRLNKIPKRIECFDNSHLQGTEIVSSMVVFEDGKPKKSDYRKFKSKDITHNDDFGTMKETVLRRYKRLIDEKANLPDLIVIDGGKGQLSAAVEALDSLGIKNKVAIVGLAKRLEEIFFPENNEPVLLPKTSSSLRLLQQIRDEAHRVAITFHRQLRAKRTIMSELSKIKGIGKTTIKKLLEEFGSVKNIINTHDDDLLKILNKNQLNNLKIYFTQNRNQMNS